MEKRYNLTRSDNTTPGPYYLECLKKFPSSFTKQEFIEGMGITEKRWNSLRKHLQTWYDPKEADPFKEFRGEFYFPDHGMNLITGMREGGPDESYYKFRARHLKKCTT